MNPVYLATILCILVIAMTTILYCVLQAVVGYGKQTKWVTFGIDCLALGLVLVFYGVVPLLVSLVGGVAISFMLIMFIVSVNQQLSED